MNLEGLPFANRWLIMGVFGVDTCDAAFDAVLVHASRLSFSIRNPVTGKPSLMSEAAAEETPSQSYPGRGRRRNRRAGNPPWAMAEGETCRRRCWLRCHLDIVMAGPPEGAVATGIWNSCASRLNAFGSTGSRSAARPRSAAVQRHHQAAPPLACPSTRRSRGCAPGFRRWPACAGRARRRTPLLGDRGR